MMVLLPAGFFHKSWDWLFLTWFQSHIRRRSSSGPRGWSALMWPGLCVCTWPGSEEEAPVRDKGALCRPFSGLAQSSRGFHTQAQGLPRATFENYYLKAVRQFTFCSQKQSSKKGGEGWRETGRVIVGRAWKTAKGGRGQRENTAWRGEKR